MGQKLTKKQQKFIQEYLSDAKFNATQAAVRAGYSAKTAHVQGPRLLANVRVKEKIDAALERRAKKYEVTQENVLKELSKLAFTDIKEYLEFRTEKTVVDYETDEEGNRVPIYDYTQIVEMKDSARVDGAPISEVHLQKDGTLKFKLHDKKGSLELLGRHLKMFTDKLEQTGKDGGPIETNQKIDLAALSAEELKSLERIIGKATLDSGDKD